MKSTADSEQGGGGSEERRADPSDGVEYTFNELKRRYRHEYAANDIIAYWRGSCKRLGGKSGRSKSGWVAVDDAGAARRRPQPAAPSPTGASGAAHLGTASVAATATDALAASQSMAAREADWRVGGVVYQVFVDRFAPPADLDARRHLFPPPCTLHAWSEPPTRGGHNVEAGYWEHELQFWGGDLPGLTAKLPHLVDLNVDVLYLQPICKAFSNHKYDATDYCEVEPQYGSEEDFKSLANCAHSAGMRLVLDGVFNHMGSRSDCVQEALRDPKSAKRGWFYMGEEHPQGFKTWGCSDSLVELRLEDKGVQDYLWSSGPESVVGSWLRRGADGWRLDVAQELGFDNLAALTQAAHAVKPGSLVVGEVWAYPSRWTNVMDGVLSLHLGTIIFAVVEGKMPGPSLTRSVADLAHASGGIEPLLRSWIVLSNHDMPRLAHRLKNARERELAQVLQFTLPGCPLIYYGDELGLEGGDDPDNRATFPWEKVAQGGRSLEHTKMLTALRRRHRGLRIGDFHPLPSGGLLAFARTTERVKDTVVVVANCSGTVLEESVVVPDPRILGHTLFRDALPGGSETRMIGATLTAQLEPGEVRVYEMVEEDGPSGAQYKRVHGHWASFGGVPP